MTNTGQRETAASIAKISGQFLKNDILPVFRGLDDLSVSGKEIASIVGVTAPTFSKWRSGQVKVPESKLVFLTLLLAHWFDELEAGHKLQGGIQTPKLLSRLKTIRRCLYRQETINQSIPPETVREGSHLFRQWWFKEDETTINSPRMAS